MNTNNVKKYAPRARKAFIEAMSKQAAKYGITKNKIEPAEQKGDLVLIGDRPFPASIIRPRERLVKRIEQQSFDQVMEHVAYSWFNRLCAIRYMERKGFLDHGRRVLSAADGSAGVPQILEECLDVELPGLDQAKVRELKLDGNKDEELYRELLLAQCHALHQAMPFLFEAVADESELLLPENLTKTDSLIRDLVASVPDEDWDHIEIIGWLYQFYISDKKDQVIGKVVKSEDIPAATQLFTPNWIVQYLVQNSVGRQWLQTYPDSPLREKMPYYIEPAEQSPEVQATLAGITPSEIAPESIKVLDPAAGSGHILVEAYKVLKAIYEERGYRTRDIPQLILENNLFGLDIDDRAGQLAGFALMMLAREDDRRIFSRNIRLNVLSLQESTNVNLPSLWKSLNLTGEWQSGTSRGLFEEEQKDLSAFVADNRYQLLQRTIERLKQAKTFGSLIEVPHDDYEGLRALFVALCELENAGDSMQKAAAAQLLPYVHQALLLSQKYDAVVANPPYMGSKGMNTDLKVFVKKHYPNSKSDLFACFMECAFRLLNKAGFLSQVNMQAWMFLSSYEKFREYLLRSCTINSLLHIGYNSFPELNSKVVQCAAVCIQNMKILGFISKYINLNNVSQSANKQSVFKNLDYRDYYSLDQDIFNSIPGSPLAYWVNSSLRRSFNLFPRFDDLAPVKQGMATGCNDEFVRAWWEVSIGDIGYFFKSSNEFWEEGKIYAPYNKGGEVRKWYGNNEWVIKFDRENFHKLEKQGNHCPSREYYFRDAITWGLITSASFSARFSDYGAVFDVGGSSAFPEYISHESSLCLLNSELSGHLLRALNPTLNTQVGDIKNLPTNKELDVKVRELGCEIIQLSKDDWNTRETSFAFKGEISIGKPCKINSIFEELLSSNKQKIDKYLDIENAIHERLCESYSINIGYSLTKKDVTLYCNPFFTYSSDCSLEELNLRYRCDYFCRFVSYSIGCAMGRYSLTREGLIYANSSNKGFTELVTEGVYETFPADDDGIIPLTDQEWFPDDATNRFREFVKVVWGEEHLHENLDFVAESLCLHAIKPKKSESSMDTIRRYLSTQFYKDHLKTYKKRPIYWLFSSGKQKAFECLVYLHRYNESTLARMRTEYVIPLTSKLASYVEKLEKDKDASGSAAEIKKLEKEIATLHKQQAELSTFDEKLRHYADQRISLDLDDGVKVNYGKFGDLLAEVKAVTGVKPGEM
jgi:hypothetical protein